MILNRPRRNRQSEIIRSLVRETRLSTDQLIYPLFITEGVDQKIAINSMPGIYRYSLDQSIQAISQAKEFGIRSFALFPSISSELKNPRGLESINPDGLLQRAIKEIKNKIPEVCLFTDVALDPYSSDGHDGIVENGKILNDETLSILAQMAVSQAKAGSDFVAPSDMMDGRVGVIREALDQEGFTDVGILAYSAKYASSFYGPFRDALDSAPKMGDKKTYQMDPANSTEALREVRLDIEQGADIVMVKPALAYLDVISNIKKNVDVPVAAYNVSGEYAMIKACAEKGWIDEKSAQIEVLTAIKRAGADIILTYFALDVAQTLNR